MKLILKLIQFSLFFYSRLLSFPAHKAEHVQEVECDPKKYRLPQMASALGSSNIYSKTVHFQLLYLLSIEHVLGEKSQTGEEGGPSTVDLSLFQCVPRSKSVTLTNTFNVKMHESRSLSNCATNVDEVWNAVCWAAENLHKHQKWKAKLSFV
jgi:hypothetical protein